ncbi:MAG: hypothetical protein E7368_02565 [Clostridiales bacterium]|nr:hypothetical protein [Clostridiales bacterium]
MQAESLKKRIFTVAYVATAFLIVFGIYLYTRYLNNATVEAVSQNYYLLVSDSTHVEASTHQIVLNGGAGYLLEMDGREYVTISAYPTRAEAEKVQSGLAEKTTVLSVGRKQLYFKSAKEKKRAKQVVGALSCLEDAIEVLHQEISRLENGATQESSKKILQILKKQFDYLGTEYGEEYEKFAKVCQWASEFIGAIMEDVVYARDMRYLECALCVSYHELTEEFSL